MYNYKYIYIYKYKKKNTPGARDASRAPPVAHPEHCHPLIAHLSR